MTLKEADEVACLSLPIEYDGAEYERIEQIGYSYGKQGKIPFVVLRGKNCLVSANPSRVYVKSGRTKQ